MWLRIIVGTGAVPAGLALLALGGYVPPNGYQADLLLTGVLLLAFPGLLNRGREPRRRRGRSRTSGSHTMTVARPCG